MPQHKARRYSPQCRLRGDNIVCFMDEDNCGDYVLYHEYCGLLERAKELEEQLENEAKRSAETKRADRLQNMPVVR